MAPFKIAAAGFAGLLSASVLPTAGAQAFNPAPLLSRLVTAADACIRPFAADGVVIRYCSDHRMLGEIDNLWIGDDVRLHSVVRGGANDATSIDLE